MRDVLWIADILSMLFLALSDHSNVLITSRTEYLTNLDNVGILLGAKETKLSIMTSESDR